METQLKKLHAALRAAERNLNSFNKPVVVIDHRHRWNGFHAGAALYYAPASREWQVHFRHGEANWYYDFVTTVDNSVDGEVDENENARGVLRAFDSSIFGNSVIDAMTLIASMNDVELDELRMRSTPPAHGRPDVRTEHVQRLREALHNTEFELKNAVASRVVQATRNDGKDWRYRYADPAAVLVADTFHIWWNVHCGTGLYYVPESGTWYIHYRLGHVWPCREWWFDTSFCLEHRGALDLFGFRVIDAIASFKPRD